jgi:phage terminase small subunit
MIICKRIPLCGVREPQAVDVLDVDAGARIFRQGIVDVELRPAGPAAGLLIPPPQRHPATAREAGRSTLHAIEKITPMPDGNLSKKQQTFVTEYLVDFNAAQAAIRAGYRPTSARSTGSRNLRKPAVRAAIAAAQAPRLAALELSAEEVLRELARVARANLLDYMRIDDQGMPHVDLTGLTRDRAAAIRDIEVESFGEGKREGTRIRFKMHDKLAALDRLARHYGLFTESMGHADEDAASAAQDKPQHDPRQVARAILLILREAAEADAAEAD